MGFPLEVPGKSAGAAVHDHTTLFIERAHTKGRRLARLRTSG